jgi:capsid protein
MPAIRSLSIGSNKHAVEVVDTAGLARAVSKSDVSKAAADGKTAAQVETIMNDACAKADYTLAAHVFSLEPLDVALMAADAGTKLAADWWTRPAKVEASPRAHFEARRKELAEKGMVKG